MYEAIQTTHPVYQQLFLWNAHTELFFQVSKYYLLVGKQKIGRYMTAAYLLTEIDLLPLICQNTQLLEKYINRDLQNLNMSDGQLLAIFFFKCTKKFRHHITHYYRNCFSFNHVPHNNTRLFTNMFYRYQNILLTNHVICIQNFAITWFNRNDMKIVDF